MKRLAFLCALLLPGAASWAASAGTATLPPQAPLTEAVAHGLVGDALDGRVDGPFELTLARPRLPLANSSGAPTEIAVEQLHHDAATGNFSALLVGRIDGALRFRLPAEGRVRALVEVPVPARGLAAGARIDGADLDHVAMRASRLPRGALTDEAQLIGAEARRRLTAGRPVRERDVQEPRLVHRGRTVRLVYDRPGLRLTALGTAREDGALGELVRVRNVDSRQHVQGVVTGPDEVTVESAPSP